MKSIVSIVGLILIVIGILGFAHKYFSYTTNENVAEIGNVKVTAEKEKVVYLTPAASAIMLVAGVILVVVSVSRKM